MIGKVVDVSLISLDEVNIFITVNHCLHIQSFETFLVFYYISRLPHRYSEFLVFPHSSLNPTTALIFAFEYRV